MARYTRLLLAAITALVLACSGRGHAPEDSSDLHCFQEGLDGLRDYCDGVAVADLEDCIEGEVRINCTAVFDIYGEGIAGTMEDDRCAPADFVQSICGEIIPCSVGAGGTIYLQCGEPH